MFKKRQILQKEDDMTTKSDIKDLQERMKQLECDHRWTVKEIYLRTGGGEEDVFEEYHFECKGCGKRRWVTSVLNMADRTVIQENRTKKEKVATEAFRKISFKE